LASEVAWEQALAGLILWQPVLRGDVYLTQFLRLRLAAGLAVGRREAGAGLRARLAAGESLEVGGYELHPELAADLDRARLQPPPPGTRIAWLELTTAPEPRPAPAVREWVDARRAEGVEVVVRTVTGEPFWATSEIVCVPALIEATLQSLELDG
jgi:exosortase A-associated hydrolase 2